MTAAIIFRIVAAAVIAGLSCAAAGFVLSHLRLTFLGVTMSHAAMSGAVIATLLDLSIFGPAFAAALLAAFLIGPLSDRANLDSNLVMSIIFSVTLGVSFMGIGLAGERRMDMLGLIWGSVLLMPSSDLVILAVCAAAFLLFLIVMEKEVKAVLFSRRIAAGSGIAEGMIVYLLLAGSGAVITASLQAVGGLMLFSLLTNPVAAAARWFPTFRGCLIGSAMLGAVSSLAGLGLSAWFNLPVGACIVLAGAAIFVASLIAPGRARPAAGEA
jgi:manganese/iron transport system permease protein